MALQAEKVAPFLPVSEDSLLFQQGQKLYKGFQIVQQFQGTHTVIRSVFEKIIISRGDGGGGGKKKTALGNGPEQIQS